jgi:hypothetical protein
MPGALSAACKKSSVCRNSFFHSCEDLLGASLFSRQSGEHEHAHDEHPRQEEDERDAVDRHSEKEIQGGDHGPPPASQVG